MLKVMAMPTAALTLVGPLSTRGAAGRRAGARHGAWLEQMMARKPRMLVTVALAN